MKWTLKRRRALVDAALRRVGFEPQAELGWSRGWGEGVRQSVDLTDTLNGDWHSFQISLSVNHARVDAFVATLLHEETTGVSTLGGQLSRLVSNEQPDGWILHASERMDVDFEGVVHRLIDIGIPALDEVSEWDGLLAFAKREAQAPGTSWLGIRHLFELPAILYLGRCCEDVELVMSKVIASAPRSPEGMVVPFEMRDDYFQRLRELMSE